MKITKYFAVRFLPFCLVYVALGTLDSLKDWYGPAVIFGGIYCGAVAICALAEYEGFFGRDK